MKNRDAYLGMVRRPGFILLGWLLLIFAVVAVSALSQRQKLLSEFQTEAAILHRLASQRADQHDAHLTSLSALAVAGGDARPDLFLEVASTIRRFYPRIGAIDLVPLDPSAPYWTTRSGLPEEQLATIRRSARGSSGRIILQAAADRPADYLMVKRSPNSDDARFALAMQIDTAALLASDAAFWSRSAVSLSLLSPDGTVFAGERRIADPQFEKVLGSASQPFVLQARIAPVLSDLLPPGRLSAFAGIATFLYLLAVLGLRQLARTRYAESRARLSAQEARLAHASRVNALGEMASGMAHELTQPLTAILSQAQAGRHLASRGAADELSPVLESIVNQAKRASAILDRLRNWTRPHPKPILPTSVNEAVRSVELLLRPEAERADIVLSTNLEAHPMSVYADQIELEQIIFNLARNAMDAVVGTAERLVTISARQAGAEIAVEVADCGAGVPDDIRQRLFEPFVSGKPDGTGLGLALCQRLAERMEGTLTLVEDRPGTVFRLRLPKAGSGLSKAAAE